jgi:hypothetical protein
MVASNFARSTIEAWTVRGFASGTRRWWMQRFCGYMAHILPSCRRLTHSSCVIAWRW